MSPAADALQSSLSGSSATRVSRPTPLACPGACAPGRSDACAADRPAHVAMADRSAAARVGAGVVADAEVLRAVPTPGREGSATGSRVCDSRGTLHRAVGSRWWRWLPVGSCHAAMQEFPVWGTGGPRNRAQPRPPLRDRTGRGRYSCVSHRSSRQPPASWCCGRPPAHQPRMPLRGRAAPGGDRRPADRRPGPRAAGRGIRHAAAARRAGVGQRATGNRPAAPDRAVPAAGSSSRPGRCSGRHHR